MRKLARELRKISGGEVAGRAGFTLIELLVVVGILTVLMAVLLPSLARARDAAKVTVNLTNLRGMGLGTHMYLAENDGWFFVHEGYYNPPGQFSDDFKDISNTQSFTDGAELESLGLVAAGQGNVGRRSHWPDYVFEYAGNPKFYKSPMLTDEEIKNFTVDFVKPGVYKKHKWGGYGYNYQFLGRAWSASTPAFRAKIGSHVQIPSETVVIADSAGSRNGAMPPGGLMANSYAIDPPLYTVNMGAKRGKFYRGTAADADADVAATALGSSDWRWRVFPAPRNKGKAGFVFADGHAETKLLKEIDDYDNDGVYDNGYWNGTGDCSAVTGR